MGRVIGFIALAIVIGVATALVVDRLVIGILAGMLVLGGILIMGILKLIGRPERPGPEP